MIWNNIRISSARRKKWQFLLALKSPNMNITFKMSMFTWEMSRVVVRRSREVRVREEETYCYATYCRWLYSDRCPDAGPRGPGAGPRPAAYWSSLRPRQRGGAHLAAADRCAPLCSALLLPCHVATTAPESRILSIPLYIPLKWCLCKVMIMSYWIINYMTMIFEDLPPSLCPPFTFPLGENRK